MELLPSEILDSIFLQLDFKQKAECMLVCRSWADTIRSKTLLDTITINIKHEGDDILERFVDTLDSNPGQCAQVKHLVLKNNDPTKTVHERVLFGYFTHLDSVFLSRVDTQFVEPLECKMDITKKVRQHISKIVDLGYSRYTKRLLASGLCTRLTHLNLHVFSIHADDFFASLTNAPNLLHLTLSYFCLTIDILEILHSKLKQLETLVMEYVDFMIKYDISFLADVVPAPSIKTFFLQTISDENESKQMLLEYAKRKYSHLENFGFWFTYSAGPFDDDNNGVSEFEVKDITPFVQHYGPQLESLKIQSLTAENEEESIFTKMDESGCQLQKLTIIAVRKTPIFKLISISNQSKYIQELVLHNMYDIGFYEQLNQFTSLTKLELELALGRSDFEGSPEFNLNRLLDVCSDRLKTLHLGSMLISFDTNVTSERQYHLKKLSLTNLSVPQGFDEFLSQHFQNLRYLKLANLRSPLRSLNLANLHLIELCLLDMLRSPFNHVSIETLDDKKYRDYAEPRPDFGESGTQKIRYAGFMDTYGISIRDTILPRKKYSTFTDADPTSEGFDDTKKCFKVVCESVQNVILQDRLCLLI